LAGNGYADQAWLIPQCCKSLHSDPVTLIPKPTGRHQLSYEISVGNYDRFAALLATGHFDSVLNTLDKNSYTALHWAVLNYDDPPFIRDLLAHGADPNKHKLIKPLGLALCAPIPNPETVRMLLEAWADPLRVLMSKVPEEFTEVRALLLEHGAVADRKYLNTVRLNIYNGADASSFITSAIRTQDLAMEDLLMSYNAVPRSALAPALVLAEAQIKVKDKGSVAKRIVDRLNKCREPYKFNIPYL
jgi:hypothetical protein